MKVGFVGWRGMVGSVLMERMAAEKDFDLFESVFFSASNPGAAAPKVGGTASALKDANDIASLKSCDTIVTCQGGEYSNDIHPRLRAAGWNGYWIDAASALRMKDGAVIILDPVNRPVIERAIRAGAKDYIGGNCTVSLMLMAIDGLLKADLVEWVTAMTYQAASGAGAQAMRELIEQMGYVHAASKQLLADPKSAILDIDRQVTAALNADGLPRGNIGVPLAGSLITWIDKDLGNGVSREEWKGGAEANKILGLPAMGQPGSVIVEGICVRIGAMRCHSQALTMKLKRDLPLAEIERRIAEGNAWVRIIKNDRENSISELSPAKVSGTMQIPVGRLRKLAMGGEYVTAFTVGDQLLWGAAEPLRRMVRMLLGKLD
jgi:aspartate-semialdehyde dehydrogenase